MKQAHQSKTVVSIWLSEESRDNKASQENQTIRGSSTDFFYPFWNFSTGMVQPSWSEWEKNGKRIVHPCHCHTSPIGPSHAVKPGQEEWEWSAAVAQVEPITGHFCNWLFGNTWNLSRLGTTNMTESAMLNRPCNCPEGEILSRIDWTQKVTPTPTISAGIQNSCTIDMI